MAADYFPPDVLHARPESERLFNDWFSQHLHSMGEPALFPAPNNPSLTFRFLLLPTWSEPYAVRVEQRGEEWWLVGRMTEGDGGYEPGPVIRTVEGRLSGAEAQRLVTLLGKLSFWNLPTAIDDTGRDGTTWVLEGAEAGRYHMVHRWCPDRSAFAEFCAFLGNWAAFTRGSAEAEPPLMANRLSTG